MKTEIFKPGFYTRPATLEDIDIAYALFDKCAIQMIGESEFQKEDTLNEWKSPDWDITTSTHFVFSPDDQLAGYAEVWDENKPPVVVWTWGRVHPDFEKRGLGSYLLKWIEKRSQEAIGKCPEDARVVMQSSALSTYEPIGKLLHKHDWYLIRHSFQMRINFRGAVPEPVFPDGLKFRPFDVEKDLEAVYRADNEVFRDHFGHIEEPFEAGFPKFKHYMVEDEGYAPGLGFVLYDGDEIAGFSLCRKWSWEHKNIGWVRSLGVRRPWRKRGLGLALLQYSFIEFQKQGLNGVGLDVDGSNLTGAVRLYEKAGMHIRKSYDRYEKELRPGKEYKVTDLKKIINKEQECGYDH